ncbi:hypothetical protein Hdeb2414_s0542g00914331 [Helianthus debilis subsp. tardiflorus]
MCIVLCSRSKGGTILQHTDSSKNNGNKSSSKYKRIGEAAMVTNHHRIIKEFEKLLQVSFFKVLI